MSSMAKKALHPRQSSRYLAQSPVLQHSACGLMALVVYSFAALEHLPRTRLGVD